MVLANTTIFLFCIIFAFIILHHSHNLDTIVTLVTNKV